jgi:hypothetical protein
MPILSLAMHFSACHRCYPWVFFALALRYRPAVRLLLRMGVYLRYMITYVQQLNILLKQIVQWLNAVMGGSGMPSNEWRYRYDGGLAVWVCLVYMNVHLRGVVGG